MSTRPEIHALTSLDRVVHSPTRAALMTLLSVVSEADFVWLQDQSGLTAGNISSHMSRLEEAGYVAVDKQFVDRRPQTRFRLTEEGRVAYRAWREALQAVFRAVG